MNKPSHLSKCAPLNAPDRACGAASVLRLPEGLNSELRPPSGRLVLLNPQRFEPEPVQPMGLIGLAPCVIKVARKYFTQ
jgi:hypothetical protein